MDISNIYRNPSMSVEVIQGQRGMPGKDGYTPVKGTDYWTDEDKAEIKSYCQIYIDTQILGGES